MRQMNLLRSTLLAATLALPTLASLPITARPAQAARWCWCTDYVANRFNLTRNYPHAGDWNDGYLQRNGLNQTGAEPGAIVVMERSFPGADSRYGHVGIVERVLPDGRIEVRGANQGSPVFTEANCNNVRVTTFGTSTRGRRDISFWKRGNGAPTPPPATNPPASGIRSVNFSATAAPAGVNIRSGPSLSAAVVGRLAPNQRANFDAWTYGSVVNDLWLGKPDARWYRIAGTNHWVASAVVYGNAPGSKPMP